VDAKGRLVFPVEYDEVVFPNNAGIVRLVKGDTWWYANMKGERVLGPFTAPPSVPRAIP
jgi:hypothetical protein